MDYYCENHTSEELIYSSYVFTYKLEEMFTMDNVN